MKMVIILTVLFMSSPAVAMSDRAYRAYRSNNACQIQATHDFNMGQIYKMQNKHDRAVARHFYSMERTKERRHEIEMQKLRNQRPARRHYRNNK